MNEALSTKLLDDFPRLFRHRDASSLQRGFECGDGWFDLIYKLAQDIEAVAYEGGLNPDGDEWPQCRQVKEKMGSLRFVVFAVAEYRAVYKCIGDLILAALNQSLQICERCGKPVELVTKDCIATGCPEQTCHGSTTPATIETR